MHKNTHQDTYTFLPKDLQFEGEIYHVHRKCFFCHDEYIIYVPIQDYYRWQGGEFVQNVFTYLDEGQREMIQTGYHPDCYDNMFSDED